MSRSHHPLRLHDLPPSREQTQRYLRSFDPRRLYRHPGEFPRVSAQSLFGVAGAALFLEIGCGTGEFLIALAARTPGAFFVGVERQAKALFRAVHASAHQGLTNIIFIKTDARLLPRLCEPGSLAAVYHHFPHPYHKARYRRSGVLTPGFLATLHPLIAPDGYVSVLTDSLQTWSCLVEILPAIPMYRGRDAEPFRLRLDDGLKSFCHRKWERKGRAILRMELYPAPAGAAAP